MENETLLYGCKIGQPDYMEEILYKCKGYTNEQKLMKKGNEWALKNNYDRLRIHKIDFSKKPDFKKSVNL